MLSDTELKIKMWGLAATLQSKGGSLGAQGIQGPQSAYGSQGNELTCEQWSQLLADFVERFTKLELDYNWLQGEHARTEAAADVAAEPL